MTPRSNRPSGTLYRPSWGLFMAKSQMVGSYRLIYLAAFAALPPLIRCGPARSGPYRPWRWQRAALPNPSRVSAGWTSWHTGMAWPLGGWR
jgi:hypothetical protein